MISSFDPEISDFKSSDSNLTSPAPNLQLAICNLQSSASALPSYSICDAFWLFFILGICAATAMPIHGFVLPAWIQPSLVGLIWGSQFLIGFWLGAGRPRPFLGATAAMLWSTLAMSSATDFSFRESLLLGNLQLAAGWLVTRWDRRTAQFQKLSTEGPNDNQWPMSDLFLLTAIVACIVSSIGHWTAPLTLLVSVAATLLVSCCCSWAAYQWSWNDDRPIGLPMIVAILFTGIAIYAVTRLSPTMQVREIAHWLLAGPASVVASQTFVVLLALGMSRNRSPDHPRKARCEAEA